MVGDFTFVAFDSDIVVTQRVAEGLKKFGGFEAVPIEMVEDSKAKERDAVRRRKRRVPLPYEGPNLFELWITQIVPLDLTRSSVRLAKECGTCGQRQYEVVGIESVQLKWDSERSEYVKLRKARGRANGIFIAEQTLGAAAIFRVREFPGWVLCTEPVTQCVTQAGFTNVAFLEIGETF